MYFTTFLVQEDGCESRPGTGEKTANVTSGKTTSNNQLRNQYRSGLCLQARFRSSISLFCMSLLPQLSNNRHVRFGSGVVHIQVFQGSGTNLQTCDNLWTRLQISERKWMDGVCCLTAPWQSSTSLSVKYGSCLNGFTEIRTGPMQV